jgi:hypothetical protein
VQGRGRGAWAACQAGGLVCVYVGMPGADSWEQMVRRLGGGCIVSGVIRQLRCCGLLKQQGQAAQDNWKGTRKQEAIKGRVRGAVEWNRRRFTPAGLGAAMGCGGPRRG